MASVWSAADAATNLMTLSNGGLTVQQNTAGGWTSIRSTVSKTAGKLYAEFACSAAFSSGPDLLIGLASAEFNIGSLLGVSNYSFGDDLDGTTIFVSPGFAATGGGLNYLPALGDVLAIAVDFTTGRIWLAKNNVWSDGGNPSAGTSPPVTFVPATVGPLFLAMSFFSDDKGAWTLQATAASQKYAPPSGFGAWDTAASLTYVDLAGNIGGISHYGRLAYGRGAYSRIRPFAPVFAGDFDLVGSAGFAGDFAPVVTFAGDLTFAQDMAGDLAPSVTFAANLGLVVDLVGDMAPQVALGASLAVDLAFEAALDGAFAFMVVFNASSMISGPLWASSEPCPLPPWAPTEPCPPTMWEPTDPCDPVEWYDTVKCNG